MANVTELQINGTKRQLEADAERSLLSVLRDDLDLSGCKYGCGEGQCGACTVLIDGKPTRSCITPLADCAGKTVTTIEGIPRDGKLHPLQQAFIEFGAMQCGYCTTGMIMAGCGLLAKNAAPTAEEIVKAMQGNICRCGTYSRIALAVRKAAEVMKGGAK